MRAYHRGEERVLEPASPDTGNELVGLLAVWRRERDVGRRQADSGGIEADIRRTVYNVH